MVEIREECSTPYGGGNAPSGSSTNDGSSTYSTSVQRLTLVGFLKTRQMDAVLFLTRIVTVLCAFYYIFPIGHRHAQNSAYFKAFAAAAATNALRVHQRVGGLRFTREFLSTMIMEDSCHYLMYSILFITATPVTMAIMPIFLYAMLHAVNFAVQLCYATGKATDLANKMFDLTRQNTQNLLGVIACSEVLLMPMLIAMVFMGKASFFLPFLYYRFVTLRYMSRRNHSTRLVFYQLRVFLEQTVSYPACPQMIRNAVYSLINFTYRLCPTTY